MNEVNRAAQFAPFDALKGLQEALKEKEEKIMKVEKKELSQDEQEALSLVLSQLKNGMLINTIYYFKGHYISVEGRVGEINAVYKYIRIGQEKIFFTDIYNVDILEA